MSRSVQIGLRRFSAIPLRFVAPAGLLPPARSLKRVAVNVLGDALAAAAGDEPFPRLLPVRQAPDPGVPVSRPILHRPACGNMTDDLSSRPHDPCADIAPLYQLRFRLRGTGWHGVNRQWSIRGGGPRMADSHPTRFRMQGVGPSPPYGEGGHKAAPGVSLP